MNEGKLTSVLAAAQVGKFHRDTGHWPRDRGELIAHACPGLDEATSDEGFEIDPPPFTPGCQFFIRLRYKIELQQRVPNLQIVLRDPAEELVCRLVVVAPKDIDGAELVPQIKMRTMLFGCPGKGKRW